MIQGSVSGHRLGETDECTKPRHLESRRNMLFFLPIIPFRFIGTRRIRPNTYDDPVMSQCGYPFIWRSPILCCH